MGHLFTGFIDRILAKPIRYLFETPTRLLKTYVKHGMTVLDVGCGAGYYSLGMARLVGPEGRVVSVDTQPEAIATLRKRAQQAGLSERIETRICSKQDLGISDLSGQIDFALAIYVLHHAADASSLINDVHRSLKLGGKFLVVEPKHHASVPERRATEAIAQGVGFELAKHPKLKRDWAVTFVKR